MTTTERKTLQALFKAALQAEAALSAAGYVVTRVQLSNALMQFKNTFPEID